MTDAGRGRSPRDGNRHGRRLDVGPRRPPGGHYTWTIRRGRRGRDGELKAGGAAAAPLAIEPSPSPEAISPNGDGQADTSTSRTGSLDPRT